MRKFGQLEIGKVYRIEDGWFKYIMEVQPIDFWELTVTAENIVDYEKQEVISFAKEDIFRFEKYIKKATKEITGETPCTVRFSGLPDPDYSSLELIGFSKIRNNGQTYVFCNDLEFMKLMQKRCTSSFPCANPDEDSPF